MNGSDLAGLLINRGMTVIASGPRAAHAHVANIVAHKPLRCILLSAPNIRGTHGGLNGQVSGATDSSVTSISISVVLFRPCNTLGRSRVILISVLHDDNNPTVTIVGGASLIGRPTSLRTHGRRLGTLNMFSSVCAVDIHSGSNYRILFSTLDHCTIRNPRCFSSSTCASVPRGRLITRIVHRGTLLFVHSRVPRNVTIIIRHFGRHPNASLVSVSMGVCYRHRDRGNVIVKGNNTVLGGVTDTTHTSYRRFLNYHIGLRY